MANRTTIYLHGHQRERVVKTFGASQDYHNELAFYHKLKSYQTINKFKINLCYIISINDRLREITYEYGGSEVIYYNLNKELKIDYQSNIDRFQNLCIKLQILPIEFNVLMTEFDRQFHFIDFEKFHFVDDTDRINNYFKEYKETKGIPQ